MDATALARHIFEQNMNNDQLLLTLPSIEDSHVLFSFLVSLTIQGIMMLYCQETNHIDIESITREQIAYIALKLSNAGIKLDVVSVPKIPYVFNLEMRCKERVESIKDIALFVHGSVQTIVMSFEIIRQCVTQKCHYINTRKVDQYK